MVCRYIMAGALAVALLPVAGCSKTQDTAPQTKIFGQPPAFKTAPTLGPPAPRTVLCDFTLAVNAVLQSTGLQASPGPVIIGGTYTQFLFQAQVTDPNSTPGNNDVILVSASGIIGASSSTTPEETTLVLFDDGSNSTQNNFTFPQDGSLISLACSTAPNGSVTCGPNKSIPLTSNDAVANDGTYTRGFAFINVSTSNPEGIGQFRNCVALMAHQFPKTIGPTDTTMTFRFDAVDREGNLTTYPTRLSGTVPPSTFICTGDDCFCCYIKNGITEVVSPQGICHGKPGMIGPQNPAGFCNSF
jgi:hypothetical protein